jgi:hypothetical protein
MPLAIGGQATPVSFNRELLIGTLPNSSQFRASGYNEDVGTVREDVWEGSGTYVFPPAGGIQMRIASSSASDAAAGTGARTVMLVYLNASYAPCYETITLNGTTPVNTVATNILRVQDLHVVTIGSGAGNAGVITLANTAGSVTYSVMGIDINRARSAIYTVPAGKRAFIVSWRAGGVVDAHNNAFAWMRNTLRATADWNLQLTPGVFQHKSQSLVVDMTVQTTFGVNLALPAMTDIKITTVASHIGCLATGGFEGWIEDA